MTLSDVGVQLIACEPEFLVVDKAPGVGFHREGDCPGVLERITQLTGIGGLYPVHRLDRMTSGLLVVARSLESARVLNNAFAERQIAKYYLALSDRKPSKKQGRIIGDMEKARRGDWRLLRSRNNPAMTDFETQSVGQGLRLFLLRPTTGKTHQLRVAMKSLGSPILGDLRYGGAGEPEARGYLHAYAMAFQLAGQHYRYLCRPQTGARFLTQPVQTALNNWSNPWERLVK